MKRIWLYIALVLNAFTLTAQEDIYAPVLAQIERNSTTLQACRELTEAQKLSYRTGLAPADPEVGFGYLWGNPAAQGNRKDVSVRQSFDFPAVYIHRKKMADLQSDGSELSYRRQRMELLLSAKQICINLVYYNALLGLYEQQLERAEQIEAACGKKLENGSGNQLDYNKAAFNRADVEGEVSRLRLERGRLLAELQRLNGGQPVAFDYSEYVPSPSLANVDAWYSLAETENPTLQYLRNQEEVSSANIRLNRSGWLPKWSVGYMGEFIPEQGFQGVTVGLTLPLWENRNQVRQAQAEAAAVSQQRADIQSQLRSHGEQLFAQVAQLQATVNRYEEVFSGNSNADLLYKAYTSGEMPLLNYLLETDYYLTAYAKQLQARRDLELALAELSAYKL